jgi:hypothetical protein
MQDIEDRCLLLTSFVDLSFWEHQMAEKHHMDLKQDVKPETSPIELK